MGKDSGRKCRLKKIYKRTAIILVIMLVFVDVFSRPSFAYTWKSEGSLDSGALYTFSDGVLTFTKDTTKELGDVVRISETETENDPDIKCVVFDSSITSIGISFKGCRNLKTIVLNVGSLLLFEKTSFMDIADGAIIYVNSRRELPSENKEVISKITNGNTRIVFSVSDTDIGPNGPLPSVSPVASASPAPSASVMPSAPSSPAHVSPTPSAVNTVRPSATASPTFTPWPNVYPTTTATPVPTATVRPVATVAPTSSPATVEEPDPPARVRILKIKTVKKKWLYVEWRASKKREGILGYQVWYSKKKSLKNGGIESTKKNYIYLKKLKKDTQYYLGLRAYVMGDHRLIYGDFVKTKVKLDLS